MASDQIIQKLGKIKAHQESAAAIGNEAEAEHFARMLNQLLMKHKLEMTDIEYDMEVKDEPVETHDVGGGTTWKDGKRFYKEYPDVEIKQKRCEWSEDLANMISRTYGCSYLLAKGTSRIWFVGRKSNVAIVEYMYITMLRTIETLSWKEYKTARNKCKWQQIKGLSKDEQKTAYVDYGELEGYRASWINGFVNRINVLLRDMQKAEEKNPEGGTALMRINNDGLATKQFLKDLLKDRKPLSSLNGGNSWNGKGYSDGKAKADEVGLTARGMGKAAKRGELS